MTKIGQVVQYWEKSRSRKIDANPNLRAAIIVGVKSNHVVNLQVLPNGSGPMIFVKDVEPVRIGPFAFNNKSLIGKWQPV